jgi:hypothetical protein
VSKAVCVACRHKIDAAAKLCPYCGADPATGQKVDTQAVLQEMFRPRELTTSESVLEYARQRQGVVIAVSIAVVFLVLAALHQFVTARNESAVSTAPAVPLTEVADLSNQPVENAAAPMPDLKFQYDGQPKTMRTFIVEPGAVAPPAPPAPPPAATTTTPATTTRR